MGQQVKAPTPKPGHPKLISGTKCHKLSSDPYIHVLWHTRAHIHMHARTHLYSKHLKLEALGSFHRASLLLGKAANIYGLSPACQTCTHTLIKLNVT